MATKDNRGTPRPQGRMSADPRIEELVALVREGKLSEDRLTEYIERRQLSLFTKEGNDGK